MFWHSYDKKKRRLYVDRCAFGVHAPTNVVYGAFVLLAHLRYVLRNLLVYKADSPKGETTQQQPQSMTK